MRIVRAFCLAAVPAAGALLIAGCAKTTTGSGTMSTSAPSATATSAASNGVESLSATEIVAKAKQALLDAKSVRIKGAIAEEGQQLTLDMRLSEADSEGVIKIPQGSLKVVIANGTAYIQPDDAFWKAFSGGNPAVLPLVSGKWIKPKAGDPNWKEFLQLFDFNGFASQVLTPDGPVTKDGTKTIDGTPAVGVTDTGADAGTLWVATSGPAYPLLVEPKKSQEGSLTFSQFGEPVTATAPPANQIVDLGKLGG
jgi:hypothetical protein